MIGLKKNLAFATEDKRLMIDSTDTELSVTDQCLLLGLPRSSYYYQPVGETELNLSLMRIIDEEYIENPTYGIRRMTCLLKKRGYSVNCKRVQRLMRCMGLEAIYPRKNLSQPHPSHKIYPYLLNGMQIEYSNHVWSTDITYIPMRTGFLYLVAIMDWYSRMLLSWELSNTLDSHFCINALENALDKFGHPEIFNSDQGSQFTSNKFCDVLNTKGIRISMDGRGRALDNVFIERVWRTLKYEEVYLNAYENGAEAERSISNFFIKYNSKRPHQSLRYFTPQEVYYGQKLLT